MGSGKQEQADGPEAPTRNVQPYDLTLAQAAELLRTGQLSAVELVEACLARIRQVDGELKACVTVMADAAREQAKAADEALRAKRARSPLVGIPMGVKDIIKTRGVRTTAGSHVLDDWIPDEDATVATRLRAAGAIPLAKTNTHEFAFGTITPPTRNPWDTTRVPGGSSGGSAAAVASGEVIAALGTDTGGSIRIPAGWCGVTGLKPTFGLVSRAGIVPLSFSYDHAGPIAHTVEDCALLLDVLAGYDPRDPDSVDVPLPNYVAALAAGRTSEDAVRGTRIGLPDRYFFDLLDPEVEHAVREAGRTFEQLGAVVETVAIPEGIEELYEGVYRPVMRPEAYAYHMDQGWLRERADRYSPTVHANIELGANYSAADYIRAQQRRRAFTDAMRAVLTQVDVLLTPTLPVPAPLANDYDAAFVINEREIPNGSLRLTFPFDLTGQPALSIPCGFTRSGLPVGAQFVAGHFNEGTLLRLGHGYQRVTNWHMRRPPIG